MVMIAGASLLHRASDIASDVCLERWTNDPILNTETSSDDPDFIQARNSYLSSYGLLGLVRGTEATGVMRETGVTMMPTLSSLKSSCHNANFGVTDDEVNIMIFLFAFSVMDSCVFSTKKAVIHSLIRFFSDQVAMLPYSI